MNQLKILSKFIGEWCSFGLIDNETCDGLSNITFESSGEFVLTTVGTTTGVETEWSTDDCQIISITGDDGQGGNPQVFRLELISIVEDTMQLSGLGLGLYLRVR